MLQAARPVAAAHPGAQLHRPAGARPRAQCQLCAGAGADRAAGLRHRSRARWPPPCWTGRAGAASASRISSRWATAPTSISATCSTTWAATRSTRAILLYVESVKAARKFMSAARAAARNKPVIVVKAGRAPEGARAAASHTGALAGSDAVFDAAVAPRRHAARGHAGGAVRRRRDAGARPRRSAASAWRSSPTAAAPACWRPTRCRCAAARWPSWRRTRWPRSMRCCPAPGRAATRWTSSATRRWRATWTRCGCCCRRRKSMPCCSCMRPPPWCRRWTSRRPACRWCRAAASRC